MIVTDLKHHTWSNIVQHKRFFGGWLYPCLLVIGGHTDSFFTFYISGSGWDKAWNPSILFYQP